MRTKPRDPDTILEAVHDKQSFIEFVEALAPDFAEDRQVDASTTGASRARRHIP